MANLFILGAGGFGTALAVMTHAAGHRVAMWSYKEEEAAALRAARENARLLPGVKIAGDIGIVTDFSRLAEADFVLVAVPSAAVRSVAAQLRGKVPAGAVVVCVSKGFEPGSLKRMDEVLAEELPDSPIVILSGPSHAAGTWIWRSGCRRPSPTTPSASMSPTMWSASSSAAR